MGATASAALCSRLVSQKKSAALIFLPLCVFASSLASAGPADCYYFYFAHNTPHTKCKFCTSQQLVSRAARWLYGLRYEISISRQWKRTSARANFIDVIRRRSGRSVVDVAPPPPPAAGEQFSRRSSCNFSGSVCAPKPLTRKLRV